MKQHAVSLRRDLVKNADKNRPTASAKYSEAIEAHRCRIGMKFSFLWPIYALLFIFRTTRRNTV
jgi:hypothetical protein